MTSAQTTTKPMQIPTNDPIERLTLLNASARLVGAGLPVLVGVTPGVYVVIEGDCRAIGACLLTPQVYCVIVLE